MENFEIERAVRQTVTIWHRLFVVIDDRDIELSVQTVNGVLIGDAKTGVFTVDAEYLLKPLEVRSEHFETIRNYLKAKK